MGTGEKVLVYTLSVVVSIIAVALLNFGWLESVIIPDPCIYHCRESEAGWLFRLFYSFPSWNGSHPAPTWLNYGLTLAAGGTLGWWIGHIWTKKLKDNVHRKK